MNSSVIKYQIDPIILFGTLNKHLLEKSDKHSLTVNDMTEVAQHMFEDIDAAQRKLNNLHSESRKQRSMLAKAKHFLESVFLLQSN